ncbi:hypothetical protein [Gorillibacterium sp. CAU 1737]|uniref:hypothetical protein n=1 Tax=Gorillibacterium sp. CAU 1737 TaxID=3140362 RepID=UPI00326051CA
MNRRHCKAIVKWERDPSQYPVHEWLRDLVVIYGEVIDRRIEGDAWTVLVRITDFADRKWMTYADVAFLVEEAPWYLFETGYAFSLWAGKNIAKVTIL